MLRELGCYQRWSGFIRQLGRTTEAWLQPIAGISRVNVPAISGAVYGGGSILSVHRCHSEDEYFVSREQPRFDLVKSLSRQERHAKGKSSRIRADFSANHGALSVVLSRQHKLGVRCKVRSTIHPEVPRRSIPVHGAVIQEVCVNKESEG